ncbi:MAG TPA: translocation/assembly module TamB domain-containing protein, partial [Bacteroidales bacterium]|nr:translocation/assembly module TamB domain-containing protein [Bacteroidales bacterium]
FIRDLDLTVDNRDGMITTIVRSGMLQSGKVKGYDAIIKALVKDNAIGLNLGFNNGEEAATYADLNARVSFPEPKENGLNIIADFYPSNIVINGENWTLNPSSIGYREKDISVAGFGLSNGDQTIRFDGRLSANPEDTLLVTLNRFDASVANPLLDIPLDIKGFLTGKAEFFGLFSDNKGILLNIDGEKMSIAGDQIGDLGIHTKWNETAKSFDFLVNNTKNELTPLHLAGSYYPNKKSVDGNMSLDKFSLVCLNPVVEGLLSDIRGNISADIDISGTLDKPVLKSTNGHFEDFNFILDYTKVPYTVNGPFSISENGVVFENAIVTDRFGHEGTLTGGLQYDHFKDMRLNARLNAEHLHGLNTTAADNDSYYGRAFATGTVRLSGPFRKLLLDMNITTGRNSTIHIPLGSSSSSHTSLLTFVDNTTVKSISAYDSLQVMNTIAEKRGGYEFAVRMRVNATPDAEVHLEINKALGDVLKTRGSGQLVINAATDLFDIKGNYNIDEGSYKFVMLGLASRDFIINPGGTINFTGDVMKSDLNLEAIYRTKASIGTLIADTTSISTRRTVDCGIGITGKLANPELNFSIDIPDLDPTIKGRVESALSTEDKRLKQLLTLLLSGSFVPDEQSGIVNNTTVLYSNASEIMANQLNNVFRQLNIPLDLGFNYQPGEKGRDIFDVAVSTQLFNNRVNINGNIGNRQYMTSNQSDLVGDVDVEIKIDRTGRVRLTLFSHSADQYSNYLDQLQRNGIGLSYQEEFDDFRELFRKIFWSKRRRDEYAAQQARVLEIRQKDPLQRIQEQKSKQTQETTIR